MMKQLGLLILVICCLSSCNTESAADSAWNSLHSIEELIIEPVFPDTLFPITDFGAIADPEFDCTEAIAKAIHACHISGGGHVIVPAGLYKTGPVHLKSNVNLVICEGATLQFTKDYAAYLPLVQSRFEGNDLMNYSPLIYAFGEENIGVTGKGVLDGNADENTWWPWKGNERHGWRPGQPNQKQARDRLFELSDKQVPVEDRIFGEGHFLRPSFVEFHSCKNILISGIEIINSPMWEIHPILSENITLRDVRINSHGPNNDGFDPESSKNILVEDCYFNTGDDCIAIKSGREADGRRDNTPSENIIIRRCFMKDGHGGVVIGSEISGGCRNVFIEDCEMSSPNLDRALRIKTNSLRGGLVENIYMRNCNVGEVKEAILLVNFFYEQGDAGLHVPTVRNIYLDSIQSKRSEYGIVLKGYERSPVTEVFIRNCNFDGVNEAFLLENAEDIYAENFYVNGKPVSF